VDHNFSFQTSSRDILTDCAAYLLDKRIDYEQFDTTFKIRGVVYVDNYDVQFSIRLYGGKVRGQYTVEVRRKKSPVVPFAVFYNGLRSHLIQQGLVHGKSKTTAVSQQAVFSGYDDDGLEADTANSETLAPFYAMIVSVHTEVQKEGMRALVGMMEASADNCKGLIACHSCKVAAEGNKETKTVNPDQKEIKEGDTLTDKKTVPQTMNWLTPVAKLLDSTDSELVRLTIKFMACLVKIGKDSFTAEAAPLIAPKLFHALDQKETLLYREIHRQAATALAELCHTQSKLVLACTAAKTVLEKHQHAKDSTVRTAVDRIMVVTL
jgi:hypothetical protein